MLVSLLILLFGKNIVLTTLAKMAEKDGRARDAKDFIWLRDHGQLPWFVRWRG